MACDQHRYPALAWWLRDLPGREADAEAAYRDAAAAGDPNALRELAWWLHEQPGREAEADRIRRLGLDAHGNDLATTPLGRAHHTGA